ncbi:MAG: hypothetical protein WCY29_16055 [Novosphingobium sp.]
MSWSLRAIVFPPRGRKQRIVPMSRADERDLQLLHERRERRRARSPGPRSGDRP